MAERNSIASEPIRKPIRSVLWRVRDRLFETDERTLSGPQRVGLVALRLLWLGVRGLFRDRLHLRAAALSFNSLLAVVPAVALAFAVGKAVGLYAWVRHETIEPFLDETFGVIGAAPSPGVAALRETLESLLSLVEETSMTGLGISGLVVLVIAILRVVRGVEEAFGHIFEQRGAPRPPLRRVRAFAITVLITPLGLVYAVLAASASHGAIGHWLELYVPLEGARDFLMLVLAPLIAMGAIFVMYIELPDAEVEWRPALIGAAVAAIWWFGVQVLHVRFQVGLARWNGIYSGFGAFPVLLASFQASWLVVLVGAQITAALSNAPSLRVLARGTRRDQAVLHAIGMEVALRLAEADEPETAHEIASVIDNDVPSVRGVLLALVRAGMCQSIVVRGRQHYALSIDPKALRAFDVIEAIDHGDAELPWAANELVRPLLDARRAAADASTENLSIADLLQRKGRRARDASDTIVDS